MGNTIPRLNLFTLRSEKSALWILLLTSASMHRLPASLPLGSSSPLVSEHAWPEPQKLTLQPRLSFGFSPHFSTWNLTAHSDGGLLIWHQAVFPIMFFWWLWRENSSLLETMIDVFLGWLKWLCQKNFYTSEIITVIFVTHSYLLRVCYCLNVAEVVWRWQSDLSNLFRKRKELCFQTTIMCVWRGRGHKCHSGSVKKELGCDNFREQKGIRDGFGKQRRLRWNP